MPKEIILYNLADNVTDEQYKDFVNSEKGPLIDSLPSVKKYELVRIKGAVTGKIPFEYVGMVHLTDMDEFYQKDKQTPEFQELMAKLLPMLKDVHILYGDEVY